MANRIADSYGNFLPFAVSIVNIPATAITAGTPSTIYTPAAGKKWRLVGFNLGLSVAGSVLIKQNTVEKLRTGQLLAGTSVSSPAQMNLLSSVAGETLQIDASATGTVSGFVCLAADEG